MANRNVKKSLKYFACFADFAVFTLKNLLADRRLRNDHPYHEILEKKEDWTGKSEEATLLSEK